MELFYFLREVVPLPSRLPLPPPCQAHSHLVSPIRRPSSCPWCQWVVASSVTKMTTGTFTVAVCRRFVVMLVDILVVILLPCCWCPSSWQASLMHLHCCLRCRRITDAQWPSPSPLLPLPWQSHLLQHRRCPCLGATVAVIGIVWAIGIYPAISHKFFFYFFPNTSESWIWIRCEDGG